MSAIFILNINLNFKNEKIHLFWIVCGLIFLISVGNKYTIKDVKHIIEIYLYLLFSFLLAVFLTILHPQVGFILIKQYGYGVILISSAGLLAKMLTLQSNNNDNNNFYQSIICLSVFSACILLLSVNEDFSKTLYNYIWIPEISEQAVYHENYQARRYQGVSSVGFSNLSLSYALLYLILLFKKNGIDSEKFKVLLTCSLIFFTTLLVGQTGVYIMIFGTLIYMIRKKNLKKIILAIFGLLLLMAFLNTTVIVQSAMRVGLEPFYNYFNSGHFESKSMNFILESHIFFPSSAFEIIYGTGNFSLNPDRMQNEYKWTDIGFLKLLNGGGLVALCMWFLPFVPILKNSKNFLKDQKYVIILFFLSLCAGNFKDYYFLYPIGVTQIVFITYFYFAFNKITKKA